MLFGLLTPLLLSEVFLRGIYAISSDPSASLIDVSVPLSDTISKDLPDGQVIRRKVLAQSKTKPSDETIRNTKAALLASTPGGNKGLYLPLSATNVSVPSHGLITLLTWAAILKGIKKAQTVHDRAKLVRLAGNKSTEYFFQGTGYFYDYRFPNETIVIPTSREAEWETPYTVPYDHAIEDDYQLTWEADMIDLFPTDYVYTLQEAKEAAEKYAAWGGCQVNLDDWEVYTPPRSQSYRMDNVNNSPDYPVIAFPASGPGISSANPKLYVRYTSHGYIVDNVYAGPAPLMTLDNHEQDLYARKTAFVQYIQPKAPEFQIIATQNVLPDITSDIGDCAGGVDALYSNGTQAYNDWAGFQNGFGLYPSIDATMLATYKAFNWTEASPYSGLRNFSSMITPIDKWIASNSDKVTLDTGYYQVFRPSESLRKQLGQGATDSFHYKFNAWKAGKIGTLFADTRTESVYFLSIPSGIIPDPFPFP